MSTLDAALAGLVSHLSGLAGVPESLSDPVQDLVMADADQVHPFPPPTEGIDCEVTVAGIRRVGRDEVRQVYQTGPSLFKTTGFGNRAVDVEIRISSVLADANYALSTAENIRSRLYLPTSEDALAALGFGLAEVGDVSSASVEFDGRLIPIARVTCTFNFGVSYSDVDATTIETFEISEE